MNRANSPALGERRAAAGLYPQYRVAAVKAYDALIARRLEAVRIADPDAGAVDDFQIATPGRLDAYQVKWSRYPQPFTLQRLLSTAGGKHPLVRQLAAGWKGLRQLNAGRLVIVHLLSNDYAHHRGEDASFALFLEECWRPRAGKRPAEPIPERWRAIWEPLQLASGLDEGEFHSFVESCEFDLGYALPKPPEPSPLPLATDHLARERDLQDLATCFFRLAADPRRIVEISHAQLIRELGWQGRLELRHRHEFPDPTIPIRRSSRPLGTWIKPWHGSLAAMSCCSELLALENQPY